MSSKTEPQGSHAHAFTADVNNTFEIFSHRALTREAPSPQDRRDQRLSNDIVEYLLREVPEFRRLSELRKKGWNNPKGDRFFEKQRRAADHADDKTAKHFYKMMQDIGRDMHRLTGVFQIKSPSPDQNCILDMCMAPGGFLATALRLNPEAHALGFSLPKCNGGHNVLLPKHPRVTLKFLDITMLAADMGLSDIPSEHPDTRNFLPTQFEPGQVFDLVLCDGQVLRNHDRAAYREHREARRLTITQLSLGLKHIKPGGTMIVLLHKVESLESVQLLYIFDRFASVRLYKPTRAHATRSSFYMLASNIRSDCAEAAMAIARWESMWKIATFGTDDMYEKALIEDGLHAEVLLREFGPRLVRLGKKVWDIQANALARAPFLKENPVGLGGMTVQENTTQ
ncbi:hypothetical protein IFM46972_10786 [Aspergillus udagawae]|uniref:Ribosomal RNA methyltransferase FtsJ domain-containing protein n=1 Tax=Aspergillus udagawae TaxID=91492 RepID=A0A8H3SE42_9EURO|nr:hypothetical protein IFM46972_10786 [Aspergillus udagawae]